MPAKKKTAKKAAKKTANHISAKFDDALEVPASKAIVAVEPMEVTIDDQLDETAGEEAWPNYSPVSEEENEGVGFGPGDKTIQTVPDAIAELEEFIAATAPSLGDGEPLNVSDVPFGHEVPELGADAGKVVLDLIDALNYLWPMTKTIRGTRGPKVNDEGVLKKRVAAGRQLIAALAGLKR